MKAEIMIEINGELKTPTDWAKATGIEYRIIKSRYSRGDRGQQLIRPLRGAKAEPTPQPITAADLEDTAKLFQDFCMTMLDIPKHLTTLDGLLRWRYNQIKRHLGANEQEYSEVINTKALTRNRAVQLCS